MFSRSPAHPACLCLGLDPILGDATSITWRFVLRPCDPSKTCPAHCRRDSCLLERTFGERPCSSTLAKVDVKVVPSSLRRRLARPALPSLAHRGLAKSPPTPPSPLGARPVWVWPCQGDGQTAPLRCVQVEAPGRPRPARLRSSEPVAELRRTS